MTSNRSHRSRLARALAAVSGIGYQSALSEVDAAGLAGRLPARLDTAGMRTALDVLIAQAGISAEGGDATGLQPRYYRLTEIIGQRRARGVSARVAAAQTAGVHPARSWGVTDLTEVAFGDLDEEDALDGLDWWRRVRSASRRDDLELACPYPSGSDPDGWLPIDRALEHRDATGDIDGYEQTLAQISVTEPRDIDAWAHLGHLYLAMADDDPSLIITPPPTARERREWLTTALGFYQTAVAVGELSLPDPYMGFLTWSKLDNRPFFRGLHGLALTLWRLERFTAAERVLLNMLWLNPADNQGARLILPDVRAAVRWHDHDDT